MAVERQSAHERAESVIRQLRDVISTRVVFDDSGTIEEIHVLTNPGRLPKQVVRDIESALMAHLGLKIDHKKISVAQVQGEPEREEQPRLRISDVSVSLMGSRAQARVRLTRAGVVFEGVAEGHNSTIGQLRQVAEATIRAVEESKDIKGTLILEDLVTGIHMAGKPVIMVAVNHVSHRGEELLVGSAVIKQDSWKAVVNSTLDAVNRRIIQNVSEG